MEDKYYTPTPEPDIVFEPELVPWLNAPRIKWPTSVSYYQAWGTITIGWKTWADQYADTFVTLWFKPSKVEVHWWICHGICIVDYKWNIIQSNLYWYNKVVLDQNVNDTIVTLMEYYGTYLYANSLRVVRFRKDGIWVRNYTSSSVQLTMYAYQ